MRRLPLIVLSLLVLVPWVTPPAAHAQTLDEILAKYAEARGGADHLAAVETIVGSGTAQIGPDIEAHFRYQWKRPNRFRFELTAQGNTEVQASNGKIGWLVSPPKEPEPRPLKPLEIETLNDAADFLGALIDPKAKGHRLELVGKTEVEGTPAWEIRVHRAEGFQERIFLDAQYMVEIQEVEEHAVPDSDDPLILTTTWGDYKMVGGVLLPHYWSRSVRGDAAATLTLSFDKLEVNEPVPDTEFDPPSPMGS